jgi:hypothetical protein
MARHRFRAALTASPSQAGATALTPGAFMPCPVPVLQTLTSNQQQAVQEIYRLAQESAEKQLRQQRVWLATFSRN